MFKNKLKIIISILITMLFVFSCVLVRATTERIPVEGGYIYFDENGVITDCDTTVTSVIIPREYNGVKITSIGDNAFSNCEVLNSIELSDNVETISKKAFNGNNSLATILINIKDMANYLNRDVCMPGSLYGFYDKITYRYNDKRLIELVVPDGVSKIGKSAFTGCKTIESIEMSDDVVSLGENAFTNCTSLKSVETSVNLKNIGRAAFAGCSVLKQIVIPNGVTVIEDNTFYNCFDLEKIVLPEGLTTIEDDAFCRCGSLSYMVLTDNITFLGTNALAGLSSLKMTMNILDMKNYLENFKSLYHKLGHSDFYYIVNGLNYQYKGKTLTDLKIPEGIATINANAFKACETLVSVDIPNGVKVIGQEAFDGCKNLKSIEVPNSVINIGKRAFNNIGAVTIKGNPEFDEKEAFFGVNNVYYPCNNPEWTEDAIKYWETNATWIRNHKGQTIEEPASCVKEGSIKGICELCGETFEEKIPALGHNLIHHSGSLATCTEKGCVEYDTCSRCEYTTYKETSALGHLKTHIKKAAGNCVDGYEYDQCTRCKAVFNKKTLDGYSTYYVKSFKLSKGKKSFTAKWKKQSKATQKKFSGYQIRYSTKSSMAGSKYATAKKSSSSKKISKLKKKTKYYVQVRTYRTVGGKKYYSKWSSKKSLKTK